MKNHTKIIMVILFLSFVVALLTGFYQRSSNEIAQWSNLCGKDDYSNCYFPSISGGFPFAFVFDSPGISVQQALGPEDEFRWLPFIIDIWFYFIAFVFSYTSLKNFQKCG
jgi:hypothetical protein